MAFGLNYIINKILPVNIADGQNITQGSKADTPIVDPTLSGSEIALLKGLMKQLQGNGTGSTPVAIQGTPAVTIADGSNSTMGTKADTAVTNPTLSGSEIAILKGLLSQLQGTGSGSAPVTITGANNQLPVDMQAIYRVQAVLSTTVLTASGTGQTFTSTGYDALNFRRFTGLVNGDQGTTFYIQESVDNANWHTTSTLYQAANVPMPFEATINARYIRIKVTNSSGVAQTWNVVVGYVSVM
jgi:hypothetical protein